MSVQAQPEVAGKERTMEKLLPCPFCGETPPLKHDSGSWGYTPKSLVIECKECGVRIFEDAEAWEQGRGHFSIEKQAMEKITERWNRRAQPEVAQAERDELAEIGRLALAYHDASLEGPLEAIQTAGHNLKVACRSKAALDRARRGGE